MPESFNSAAEGVERGLGGAESCFVVADRTPDPEPAMAESILRVASSIR